MSFIIFCMLFGMMFPLQYVFWGFDKRINKLKEKISSFEKNGLSLYTSTTSKREKHTYEDKILYIEIIKKKDRLDARVFLKDLFGEQIKILHEGYDLIENRNVVSIENESNIKQFLGSNADVKHLVQSLKQTLIQKVDDLYHISIGKDAVLSSPSQQPISRSSLFPKESTPSHYFEPLEQALKNGEFDWKREETSEVYTIQNTWEIKISPDKTPLFQLLTISKDGAENISILYNTDTKEIKDINVNKGIMHKLKDPAQLVDSIQSILYACFEQSNQYKHKVDELVQVMNSRKFEQNEQSEELQSHLDYIEEHLELLDAEDNHTFLSIKEKRIPELNELKRKLSFDHSFEKELHDMFELILTSLQRMRKKIETEHERSLVFKEKLLEQLNQE